MIQAQRLLLNGPNPQSMVLDKMSPVHFIGIGGIGMSGLAKILLEKGFRVSGSDAKENSYMNILRELGGEVVTGHQASNIPSEAIVIASSAIRSDNPEIQKAYRLGLPVYHRSDLLREILKSHKISIGLTGTHGKTTITGMTGMVLEFGGLDPTIIAGGKIPKLETNAKSGKDSQYLVAELDESDGTVTRYQPTISVIANLELDHPDYYKDGLEAVINTFNEYLDSLTEENTVLFNMDCPVTRELYEKYSDKLKGIKVYTESIPEEYDKDSCFLKDVVLNIEGGYQGELFKGDECLGMLWLQVPGRHNLTNAAYAAIIGHNLGLPFEGIRKAIEEFSGMGRRFEKLGTFNGARIIDDYAHHPTEVRVTLKAAREYNRYKGRVIAMFQPHRYQRLKILWDEFTKAFDDADEVIVVDVYSAGEEPIPGISGQIFAELVEHPVVTYWPSSDWNLVIERLKSVLTPDDLFITLGAGDITQVGRKLVALS